ncbi:MAG: hypothetical protein OXP09_05335 [Gammaproteobacteria bacterium]|nr:hypothetical protein [Gammaproteobacteria bacterium]
MFDLQGFQNTAQAADPGAILVPQSRQQNITLRSGLFARLFGRVRLADNHQATGRFLQALGRSYGAEIAREVAAARGLSRLGRVTPLTARKVANAVRAADDLQARVQQNNQLLADAVRRIEPQGAATESIRTEVEREVENKRYRGIRAEITARISFEAVADKTREAIVEAGRDSRHLVGVKEARKIRGEVVAREVANAHNDYHAAKCRALAAFNPRLDGSLVFQALGDRFARFAPPLNYDEHTLTPDAAEELHQRFSDAVATWRIRPEQLDDEGALRALAEEEVGRFIDERQAARSQFDSLGFLSGAARHALLAQVSCDSIPAGLVSRAVETSLLIRDGLERLARFPQMVDSEALVENLSLAMVTAWREPGMDASETNEALVYRWLWRIALSSRSESEARDILRGMGQEHSPLRSICQAATWYAEEFPETEQHIRTARPPGDDRSFKSKAGDVSKVLNGLWVILQQKTGREVDGGRVLAADGRPNDATITALRNLGIPFPAPDRLGESNAAVPLADITLEKIGEAFVRHARSNREVHDTGLASNCMNFLRLNQNARVGRFRARFFIDGRELPRDASADTVARELIAFCTDQAGNRNDRMLAKVSRMIDPASLACVYAGCMNPELPHLAIMNGYPEGVFEGHSYSLWKTDDGAVRLGIAEMITPLYWHRFPDAGVQEHSQTGSVPTDAILSGKSSLFRTRFVIEFDPQRYEPEVGVPDIGYSLIPGAPESPYFIPRSDFPYRDQVPDALGQGQLPTLPPLNPHTH